MAVVQLKGFRDLPSNAPENKRSRMDTLLMTQQSANELRRPDFQREVRKNKRVQEIADDLKFDNVIPGVITIGIWSGCKWLVDGQHRIEAFKISEVAEAYVDVRIVHFDSYTEMADEYFELNSSLVAMRPDDKLKALESSSQPIQMIKDQCKFVGYDYIRRNTSSPVLSMSSLLRCWRGSSSEVPTGAIGAVTDVAKSLDVQEASHAIQFLNAAHNAWGRDPTVHRLWAGLNLSLCMWIYKRTVLSVYTEKTIRLTTSQFTSCLRDLSADADYVEWLRNRALNDHSRGSCYRRIEPIFKRRIKDEISKRFSFPSPAWASE